MTNLEGSELPSSLDSSKLSARTSFGDSLRGCGFAGVKVDKEILRTRILIPEYLRLAMFNATKIKDSSYNGPYNISSQAPEAPIVVFVNSKSGGRHGAVLKGRLQELISKEQVFDLSDVNPSDFFQYGLACLENISSREDQCAKETRHRLRVMVAGGDGTVGWVLGCISKLHTQKREPIPPTGIIPLGTGNDLSRSFGWGGSFPFAWRSAVKQSLFKAAAGSICHLDSWRVTITTPAGDDVHLPHSLRQIQDSTFVHDGELREKLPDKHDCFEGVFYNYFSIGMDAKVAYGFHHLRNKKPYLAQGPISNKLIYSGYSCTQGWFFTPCSSNPVLRGLRSILQLHIRKMNCSEWEQIQLPSDVRAIVVLNLNSYGSGRNPWGQLKPQYLEKRGFVEAHADDGLLEIFGLKQGWHASLVMVQLISAKHIEQASSIRLEIRGGKWKNAYMQMDGEPWKQKIADDSSTYVEIERVPFHSLMISGD